MSALNPHQFGDQGTLFVAPLGQPTSGVFKGNPAARMYRSISVPYEKIRDYRETGDVGVLTDHINRPGKDTGVDRNIGLHWQHDVEFAKKHNWGEGQPIVVEADHPGHDHVMTSHSDDPAMKTVMPDRGSNNGAWLEPNSRGVLPEVPIRPGTSLNIRAVHVPLPAKEQPQTYHRGDDSARIWNRHEVDYVGRA